MLIIDPRPALTRVLAVGHLNGYLYFFNPADLTTFAGSAFVSGVFTLDPNRPEPAVTIADTNPAAYDHRYAVAGPSSAKGAMGNLVRLVGSKGAADSLVNGYFTFTNQYGTSVGYATPDFRQFKIQVQFSR